MGKGTRDAGAGQQAGTQVTQKTRKAQATKLRRGADVSLAQRRGQRFSHPAFGVSVLRTPGPGVRFTVVASRAIGSAVARNRAKRRLRAVVAPFVAALPPEVIAHDLVVTARPALAGLGAAELRGALTHMLERAIVS